MVMGNRDKNSYSLDGANSKLYTRIIMAEPQEQNSKREREESNEAKSKRVWESVVRIQQQGGELTPEQQKALEIRGISLSIARAIDQLIEDPTIKDDAVREADSTMMES